MTAGVAYGAADALGLTPSGYDASGKAIYSEAAQQYYGMSTFDKLGDSRFWTLTGAKVGSSGVAAAANGGDFRQAVGAALLTNMAATVYQSTVGYEPNPGPGKNPEDPFYSPETKGIDPSSSEYGRQPLNTYADNVIGQNTPGNFCSQGTICSRTLNLVPFINATGGFHDYIFNHGWLPMNSVTNVGTMLPAAAISIPASLNDPVYNWQLLPKKEEKK